MNFTKNATVSLSLLLIAFNAHASHEVYNTKSFDIFDASNGWDVIADDRTDYSSGRQPYDTEFLFMKYNSDDTLSIGLQTGFDLSDGKYGSITGGDLALSFRDQNGDLIGSQATKNGDHHSSSDYNYAVDFGFMGATEGLYKVDDWNDNTSNLTLENNGVYEVNSASLVGNLSQNDLGSGSKNGYKSYYRIVTFDLNDIDNLSTSLTVDAFWTMSCGNDQIYGSSNTLTRNTTTNPVPEPSIIALIGIGTISIFASGLRRKRFLK